MSPHNVFVDSITHSLRIGNWTLARRKYTELDELYVTTSSEDTGFRSIDDKKGNVTTSTSDATSAALVIIWICTGQTYTSIDDKLFADFQQATRWCPEMSILVEKCLNPNPGKRPSLNRLMAMTNDICSLLGMKGARTAEVINHAKSTYYDPEKGTGEDLESNMDIYTSPEVVDDDDEIIIELDPDEATDEPLEEGEIRDNHEEKEEEIDLMMNFDD